MAERMILMEKLLMTVIEQDASDLHLVVGRPPTVRLNGRLASLKTRVLTPEDTVSLMKSITPERAVQELQQAYVDDRRADLVEEVVARQGQPGVHESFGDSIIA